MRALRFFAAWTLFALAFICAPQVSAGSYGDPKAVSVQLNYTGPQFNSGGAVTAPKIQKIRRAILAARTLNDADASVVSDSFTLTAPTTIDAGLTKTFQFSPANDGKVFNLFGGAWTNVNANPGYAPIIDTSAGTTQGLVQVEWITDAPKLEVGSSSMATGGSAGMLYVDGHPLQTGGVFTSTSGGTRFIELDWGGVRKIRSYRLVFAAPGWLRALWVDSASTVRPTSRDDVYRCAVDGDSIPAGTMSEAYDGFFQTYTYISMSLLGCRDIWLGAHGGSGWTVVGSYNTMPQRQAWIVAANPDLIDLEGGRNDTGSSPSVVQAAVTGELQYLRSNLPGVPIIVAGAQAGNTGPDAATIATENAISAAVTAVSDSYTAFMPVSTATDPWMQTANVSLWITGTNVHPNIVGSNYLGRTKARALPGVFPSLQGVN